MAGQTIELAPALSALGVTPTQPAFSTSVPLGVPGATFMTPTSVAGQAMAFSPASGAVLGATCNLRLTADGVTLPTFPGFTENGGSGYYNGLGVVNKITFAYDGVQYTYSVNQDVGVLAQPAISQASVSPANPSVIVLGGLQAFNTNFVPAGSAFAVNASGGAVSVSSVAVTYPGYVTLTLSRAIANSETVSATYTQPGSNPLQNALGVQAPSTTIGVTVPQMQVVRGANLNNITESADAVSGDYDYTGGNNSNWTSQYGGTNLNLQAGVDGGLQFTMASYGSLIDIFSSAVSSGFASSIMAIGGGSASSYIFEYNGATPSGFAPALTPTLGSDLLRIRRQGATLFCEVSKNQGLTWTTLYAVGGVSTGVLYFGININGANKVNNLRGFGLA